MKPAAAITALALAAAGLTCGGCRTRTLEVTSEPPGALVWLNDEQVGRTPLETDFVHYGTYDVRLRLDGYVPVSTHRSASAPLVDQPGIDLVGQMIPGWSVTSWHFVLQPLPELTDRDAAEAAVYSRATEVRDKAQRSGVGPAQPPRPVQPSGAAGTPTTVTPSATSTSTTAPAPTTAK